MSTSSAKRSMSNFFPDDVGSTYFLHVKRICCVFLPHTLAHMHIHTLIHTRARAQTHTRTHTHNNNNNSQNAPTQTTTVTINSDGCQPTQDKNEEISKSATVPSSIRLRSRKHFQGIRHSSSSNIRNDNSGSVLAGVRFLERISRPEAVSPLMSPRCLSGVILNS